MEKFFKINVLGTFNMIREYLNLYKNNSWTKGVIINISSTASEDGQ